MARFLSEQWLAEPHEPAAVALVEAGVTTSIQHVVTGGPDGEVRYGTVIDADGAITAVAGDVTDPDVTLTDTYENALAILRGELDPNAAFMSGRTKVSGHTGRLLRVLAAMQSDAAEAARVELSTRTDA